VLRDKRHVRSWLHEVLVQSGVNKANINYIFCGDEYLYQMNVEFLGHDTYTDIITFPDSNSDKTQKKFIDGRVLHQYRSCFRKCRFTWNSLYRRAAPCNGTWTASSFGTGRQIRGRGCSHAQKGKRFFAYEKVPRGTIDGAPEIYQSFQQA